MEALQNIILDHFNVVFGALLSAFILIVIITSTDYYRERKQDKDNNIWK